MPNQPSAPNPKVRVNKSGLVLVRHVYGPGGKLYYLLEEADPETGEIGHYVGIHLSHLTERDTGEWLKYDRRQIAGTIAEPTSQLYRALKDCVRFAGICFDRDADAELAASARELTV